jgi:hypothetical protein
VDGVPAVKTMRLRYAGVCAGCDTPLPAGVRAHYLRPTKTVRCLDCGPSQRPEAATTVPAVTPDLNSFCTVWRSTTIRLVLGDAATRVRGRCGSA